MAPPPDADRSPPLRDLRPDSLLGQALRRAAAEAPPAPEPVEPDLPVDEPLRVPEAEVSPVALAPEPAEAAPRHLARRGRRRSALLGIGVGLGVAVAAIAIAFSVIAIPLYLLASTEPDAGLDRDLVRKGLFFVALPFGAVVGSLIGILVGAWYARGGRLPAERSSIHGR